MPMNGLPGMRVFLHSHIMPVPCIAIAPGMVALPLKLNGGFELADVSCPTTDPAILEEGLGHLYTLTDDPRFPNRKKRFKIYTDLKDYMKNHRPAWISKTVEAICSRIDSYVKKHEGKRLPTGRINCLDNLRSLQKSLPEYAKSLLYAGKTDKRELVLDPLNLFFTGTPISPRELSVTSAINFLDIAHYQIALMFKSEMRPRAKDHNTRRLQMDRSRHKFKELKGTLELMEMAKLGMYLFAHLDLNASNIKKLIDLLTPNEGVEITLGRTIDTSEISRYLTTRTTISPYEAEAAASILAYALLAIISSNRV